MIRTDAQRIEDIRKALNDIVAETDGVSREDFRANATLQKAVLFDSMIVGDASARISKRTKLANPSFPFDALAKGRSDERSGPAHADFNLEWASAWTYARETVPDLLRKIRKVKSALPEEG